MLLGLVNVLAVADDVEGRWPADAILLSPGLPADGPLSLLGPICRVLAPSLLDCPAQVP